MDMCPNGQKLRTQKNIKNSSDTKTSGNMLVCVKKASIFSHILNELLLKLRL